MASNEKTPGLGLNQWAGSDKLRREDVNRDNLLLDEAIAGIGGQLADLAGLPGELRGHREDGGAHVTAADRERWTTGNFVVGTYAGEGLYDKVVTLGFRPRLVLVFAAGGHIQTYYKDDKLMVINMAVLTREGCMGGEITEEGFRAEQNDLYDDELHAFRLNDWRSTYVYVAWR